MATAQGEKEALLRAIETVPPEALPELRRIVELFAAALLRDRQEREALQREMEREMAVWDAARDEALTEFERRLERSA